MERVRAYIDGSNFFYGVRSIDPRYSDFKFDFEKHIRGFCRDRKYMGGHYYTASLKQELDPRLFSEQQQFLDRLRRIEGMEVVICRRKKRTDADGEARYTIKGDDIHLSNDMLSGAYENKFDTALLYSGDGDFCPTLRMIKKLGKKVEVIYFPSRVSYELLQEATASYAMSKKIVKRHFYREPQPDLTIGDTDSGYQLKQILEKKKV